MALARLKTLDTIGNCERLVFTVGVSQHMHTVTNLWKYELNRLLGSEIIMKEKYTPVAPWSHEVMCFQMLYFETSNSNSEVSKIKIMENFLKTMSLQWEPFLTMFYYINLSPLLVIKTGFIMIVIIFSNYQKHHAQQQP